MTDAHGVARDQLRAFIERIERLEEEKKTIADDIKDVKVEAKVCGFDVGTINAIIKLRKVDANERAERDAMLDTYMIALGMLPEPDEQEEVTVIDRKDEDGNHIRVTVDSQIAEILARQPAAPLRSDLGLNIQTKHEDIRTAPVTAEELQHPVPHATGANARSGGDGSTVRGARTEADAVTAGETAPHSPSDDGAIAAVKGRARLANADGVEPPSSGQVETPSDDDVDHAAGVNAGGDHVDGGAERATHLVTGEGAACALPAKPKFVLRPYCLKPGEGCGGSGTTHCHSCLKAREEVAA